ncbi:MAG: GH3 auxin-responsive promoter family protein, partial [Fulvivirga sp.]|nr:GH3 auxin-responsive promoter family protein [Fulvivirga sp.]
MGFRSVLSKPFAAIINWQQKKWTSNPGRYQDKIFKELVRKGRKTRFGKDHNFDQIETYEDFKKHVPITDYEGLKGYVNQIIEGNEDVLWPGKPAYFAKTSGTTSGTKYIPITKESIPNHINSARNALLNYVHETGNSKFLDGKLIFLSGSPVLDEKGGINTG